MKKRILALFLAIVLMVSLSACATGGDDDGIVLTMGSWRSDDVDQMNALLAEYKKIAPDVTINFEPTLPHDYNAWLRMNLEAGTGPDLMYARSFATGRELFEDGYFADCSDIPGLMDNFTDANLAPWMSDGKMFAVPFAAVSHAVYFNKDIFAENGLSIPNTWDEFIAVCKALDAAGITPLANGVADEWDILECMFLAMLPNYVGVGDQRVLYESGQKKLNDEAFVNAYSDLAMLAPFLPSGFEAVTYDDSQVLFATQEAAMFVDGSWTMEVYRDVDFNWSVFAIPARNAGDTAITFHPDMAITMNAATEHPEEARAFLAWLCTQEGATTASQALPLGFFPMINFPIALDDPRANDFLALNNGKETDARFIWPEYMDLYAPMNAAVIDVLKGNSTPQEAADSIAAIA